MRPTTKLEQQVYAAVLAALVVEAVRQGHINQGAIHLAAELALQAVEETRAAISSSEARAKKRKR